MRQSLREFKDEHIVLSKMFTAWWMHSGALVCFGIRGCLNLPLEGLYHLVKEFILSLGLEKKKKKKPWLSDWLICPYPSPLGPFRPRLHPALLAAMSRSNFWHIIHPAWTWLVLVGQQTSCWTWARWFHSITSLTLPKMMWTWTINPWASPVTQPSSIP